MRTPTDIYTAYGVDPTPYADAIDALATGERAWIVVSGKMTAGKDTIAPTLEPVLPGPVVFPRYGDLMRADLAPGLAILKTNIDIEPNLAAAAVAEVMNLEPAYAAELVALLSPDVRANPDVTPFDRTDANRIVLQNLGGHWRNADDEAYWSKAAWRQALDLIGAGNSVILTGGRFAPDVELPKASGALMLRFDVTRETQLARLAGRDNLAITPETLTALEHPGETALDDWDGFDARIPNDRLLGDAIVAARVSVTFELNRRRHAVRS